MSLQSKGYIEVDVEHQLYYEKHGQNDGPQYIFLHGGPGSQFNEKDALLFNLDKVGVIFFDQRGCGRSKSQNPLLRNTTQYLIHDILELMSYFSLKKISLVGGSWGSTLAMLFAISYPEKIQSLVLRAIFLGSKSSRNYFEKGDVGFAYPEIWNAFSSLFPFEEKAKVFDAYWNEILHGSLIRQRALSRSMMRYGQSLFGKDISLKVLPKDDNKILKGAKIMSHFSTHDFFILDDYILLNINLLPRIPIHIVHGENDQITSVSFAKSLHKAIKTSTLNLVNGGHSPYEEPMFSAIKAAIQNATE